MRGGPQLFGVNGTPRLEPPPPPSLPIAQIDALKRQQQRILHRTTRLEYMLAASSARAPA